MNLTTIASTNITMQVSPSNSQSSSSSTSPTTPASVIDDIVTLDCATQIIADELEGLSPPSPDGTLTYLSKHTETIEKRKDRSHSQTSDQKPIESLSASTPRSAASAISHQTTEAKQANATSIQTSTLEPSPKLEVNQHPRTNDLCFTTSPSVTVQNTSDLTTLNGPERYTANQPQIDCEYFRDDKQGVFVLRPTLEQWEDFPALLAFAVSKGALNDGCFKMVTPEGLHGPVPETPARNLKGHGYMPQKLRNGFWRVYTVPTVATFSPHERPANTTDTPQQAIARLKKLFGPGKRKRLTKVAYRADVPAWTSELRKRAGVPEKSTMYPLQGDMLDYTKVKIPGIHTPYVYQSAAAFGATFQLHDEDYKLISLNHLYVGRKIWLVNPSTAILDVERACDRGSKCAQFMRHRAEFIFPEKFDKLGVPCRIVDQRPGETMVILPDAYHQGLSTGYTLAEAKNYADAGWSIGRYRPCGEECKLNEAIPPDMMAWLGEGEEVKDFCAQYEMADEGDDSKKGAVIKEAVIEEAAVNVEVVMKGEAAKDMILGSGGDEEKTTHRNDDEESPMKTDIVRTALQDEKKRKRELEADLEPDVFGRVRQTRSKREF